MKQAERRITFTISTKTSWPLRKKNVAIYLIVCKNRGRSLISSGILARIDLSRFACCVSATNSFSFRRIAYSKTLTRSFVIVRKRHRTNMKTSILFRRSFQKIKAKSNLRYLVLTFVTSSWCSRCLDQVLLFE